MQASSVVLLGEVRPTHSAAVGRVAILTPRYLLGMTVRPNMYWTVLSFQTMLSANKTSIADSVACLHGARLPASGDFGDQSLHRPDAAF